MGLDKIERTCRILCLVTNHRILSPAASTFVSDGGSQRQSPGCEATLLSRDQTGLTRFAGLSCRVTHLSACPKGPNFVSQ